VVVVALAASLMMHLSRNSTHDEGLPALLWSAGLRPYRGFSGLTES
jgi:hypothetical protein